MKREIFAQGMLSICTARDREVTDEIKRVYWGVLEKLTDDEFKAAINTALREPSHFMPSPGELLAWGLADRTLGAKSEASIAFDLVLHRGSVHDIEHGARPCDCVPPYRWSARAIEWRYGVAAARAFVEVGSDRVFSSLLEKDEPFVRRRFVEAYIAAVTARPLAALPARDVRRALGGGSIVPQLPAPSEPVLGREEASAIVKRLETSTTKEQKGRE